ncbi:MAG TPA: hypothetical protein VKE96_00770 [Vicinamibacterales bacterium]|nr:hypothetical protein [Vicinamibacterales bacterium]
MDERLQLFPQKLDGIFHTHPAPSADLVFEPVLELSRHPHEVDIHAAEAVAFRVLIAADRSTRDDTSEAGFLFGLTDCRFTRKLANVN